MNSLIASYGLSKCGCWVETIDYAIGHDLSVDSDTIYYGNVGFNEYVIKKLGYSQRSIGHVPEELYSFAGRKIETVTLKEALERRHSENIFIKPVPSNHKKFTGMTFENNHSIITLANYDDNELVLLSPKINIVSEWRAFVLNDEIIDVRHYKGDFRISPKFYLEPFLKLWKNRPVAWSCDLGITDEGDTIIVECNDVLSLGWYGIDPINAGRMLFARWEEIHKNKSS